MWAAGWSFSCRDGFRPITKGEGSGPPDYVANEDRLGMIALPEPAAIPGVISGSERFLLSHFPKLDWDLGGTRSLAWEIGRLRLV
jgi:hypothetical protein